LCCGRLWIDTQAPAVALRRAYHLIIAIRCSTNKSKPQNFEVPIWHGKNMSLYRRTLFLIKFILLSLIGASLLLWGAYRWYLTGFPLTEKDSIRYQASQPSSELIYMLLGCMLCFGALGYYAYYRSETRCQKRAQRGAKTHSAGHVGAGQPRE
jgi:hypothetical protein